MADDERPRVRWLDGACHVCGGRTNSWDAKVSKALSYSHVTCEACVAKEYDKTTGELRDTMRKLDQALIGMPKKRASAATLIAPAARTFARVRSTWYASIMRRMSENDTKEQER